MTRHSVLAAVMACLLAIALHAQGAPEQVLEVRRLTDKVLVLTEDSPWQSNHVVVVGAKGLALVDPGGSPVMARLIRAAVARELGRDQFAYVIDHHDHWGHSLANQSFPEALVIAHEDATPAIRADAALVPTRAQLFAQRRADLDSRLLTIDATSDDAKATRLERDHADRIARGLAEPGFTARTPDISFDDRMTLDLGDVTLRLLFLGRGHSASDTVILIPEEGVLLVGCFFYMNGKLPVFGTQPVLDVDRWLEVLHELLDGEVKVDHVVLGQRALWSRTQLVAMRDYIAELWPAVKAVEAEGVPYETAIERLPVPARLAFLREAGVDAATLEAYHRSSFTNLWRQLKESASAAVDQAFTEGGLEAGRARCRELAQTTDGDLFFGEAQINLLGYQYLQGGKIDEALAVFELNVARFPGSWNVYDSLAEAEMTRGNNERAIELYRRSLELNPDNVNGRSFLERLEGKPTPVAPSS